MNGRIQRCINPHNSRFTILLALIAVMAVMAQPLSGQPKKTASGRQDSTNTAGERKAILFLGNSLTAGYGLDPEQAFPALIQQKLDSLGWAFEAVNAGLSGETSSGGLRRLNWLMRRQIAVLVLALGGNDGLRGIPPELTRQNLQQIIERTREKNPGVRIVLAGMEAPPNMGEDYTRQFRDLYRELAKTSKADLIPFLLKDVGGIPELNLPDGIHPTAEGHRIVAETVWEVLEPVLREMR